MKKLDSDTCKIVSMRLESPSMELSDAIRTAIDDCGMSRYELAKRSGVSQAALSRFMQGKSMTTDLLDRLAGPLGLRLVVQRSTKRKRR